MPDHHSEIETLRAWLRTEGRFIASSADFDTAFVEQLRNAGLPITRYTTGVPSLHPQVDSFSTLWEHGKGLSFRQYHQTEDREVVFRNSPPTSSTMKAAACAAIWKRRPRRASSPCFRISARPR